MCTVMNRETLCWFVHVLQLDIINVCLPLSSNRVLIVCRLHPHRTACCIINPYDRLWLLYLGYFLFCLMCTWYSSFTAFLSKLKSCLLSSNNSKTLFMLCKCNRKKTTSLIAEQQVCCSHAFLSLSLLLCCQLCKGLPSQTLDICGCVSSDGIC